MRPSKRKPPVGAHVQDIRQRHDYGEVVGYKRRLVIIKSLVSEDTWRLSPRRLHPMDDIDETLVKARLTPPDDLAIDLEKGLASILARCWSRQEVAQ